MTKHFYVYEHARPDGVVFYVGKGTFTARRGYARSSERAHRTKWWARIVAKHGFAVRIVAETTSEALAFAVERALIAEHRRHADGGSLCNLTLGGEGHSGLTPSAQTRAKLSAASSGERHFNWGKKLSPETCRRKSESMRSSDKNLRGKTLPEWWVEKIRAGKYGERNPMFGRRGARHPNGRRVTDTTTGTIYPTVTAAARAAGMRVQSLHNMLTGFRPNSTAMRFA